MPTNAGKAFTCRTVSICLQKFARDNRHIFVVIFNAYIHATQYMNRLCYALLSMSDAACGHWELLGIHSRSSKTSYPRNFKTSVRGFTKIDHIIWKFEKPCTAEFSQHISYLQDCARFWGKSTYCFNDRDPGVVSTGICLLYMWNVRCVTQGWKWGCKPIRMYLLVFVGCLCYKHFEVKIYEI